MAFDVLILIRSLIARMDVKRFNHDIRERRAAKFEAAVDSEQLDQLYSLSRLDEMLRSETAPLLNVDIYDQGHLMRLVDVQKKSASHMSGWSLIISAEARR